MNEDLNARLDTIGEALRRRAAELSGSGQERDIALLMEGLATTMEAVRSLGATVGRIDGLPGLGSDGI